MTPEEFLSLPAPVALRILFDCLDEDTSAAVLAKEKPKLPLPPKFDQVIFRKEGVMYASECDREGLAFWHKRSLESAAKGGQYAEKDAKTRDSLARWMAWREVYPDAVWSGERDREPVVAKAPSSKPTVYPRANGQRRAPSPPPQEDINPDAEIPF
jgi:hypothetical protein